MFSIFQAYLNNYVTVYSVSIAYLGTNENSMEKALKIFIAFSYSYFTHENMEIHGIIHYEIIL